MQDLLAVLSLSFDVEKRQFRKRTIFVFANVVLALVVILLPAELQPFVVLSRHFLMHFQADEFPGQPAVLQRWPLAQPRQEHLRVGNEVVLKAYECVVGEPNWLGDLVAETGDEAEVILVHNSVGDVSIEPVGYHFKPLLEPFSSEGDFSVLGRQQVD